MNGKRVDSIVAARACGWGRRMRNRLWRIRGTVPDPSGSICGRCCYRHYTSEPADVRKVEPKLPGTRRAEHRGGHYRRVIEHTGFQKTIARR